ncbi:MAG: hypothetical protein K5829_14055 [Treponema sp.]|nr:hypothetical protein [Treponema sp.]
MKKYLNFILFTIVSVFILSCGNTVNKKIEEAENNNSNGKAKVSFETHVNAVDYRTTMFPTSYELDDITKFELSVMSVSDGEEQAVLFDEQASLTWDSYADFSSASIELDAGTYSFYLDLYVRELSGAEESYQSGQLKDVTIKNSESRVLSFETKYTEEGDLSVTYRWQIDDNDVNRVGSVKMGLFTTSDLETAITGYELKNIEIEVDSEDSSYYYATYTASELSNGYYYLQTQLYDNDDDNPTLLAKPYFDLIYICGYKTVGIKDLETNYNKNYSITYDLGAEAAAWAEDFTPVEKYNSYKAIRLPSSDNLVYEGYGFKGWIECNSDGTAIDEETYVDVIDLGDTGDRYFKSVWNRLYSDTSLLIEMEEINIEGLQYALEVSSDETETNYTYTAPADFDSYAWYVDGELCDNSSAEYENIFTLSKYFFTKGGYYQIVCVVTKDDKSYVLTSYLRVSAYVQDKRATITIEIQSPEDPLETVTADLNYSSDGSIYTFTLTNLVKAGESVDLTEASCVWAINENTSSSSGNTFVLDLENEDLGAALYNIYCTVIIDDVPYMFSTELTIVKE